MGFVGGLRLWRAPEELFSLDSGVSDSFGMKTKILSVFGGAFPGQVDLGDLIFLPDPKNVGELGKFLCSPDMII